MSAHPTVGAVVLAAGTSRRFGSPKQLAEIGGRSLLDHVIALAGEAGVGAVVAVVPVWLAPPPGGANPDLLWIRNPLPELGISTSLRLGLVSLPASLGATLILLGDQPSVAQAHLAAVLGARGGRPIVASLAANVLAPPLLIERDHFWLADGLRGDVGLRDLLTNHPELCVTVEVDAHAPDVDTPADLSGQRSALESDA